MAGTVNLTGTFYDLEGNLVSNGTVTVTLRNYGGEIPRISGVAVLDTTTVTATISSGTFTISGLYGNDVITPSNTYYDVSFPSPSASGNITKKYNLTGSGTFDLSNLTPLFSYNAPSLPVSNVLPQVFSPISHQFLTGLSSSGALSSAQPAAADLSDGAVGSGHVVLASAVTGSGSAVLATSPTIASATLTSPVISSTSLVTAGGGNTVTLLNVQGPSAALTGNAADQAIYSYTIPANTIGAGKGIRVSFGLDHNSGSATPTYKLILGSTQFWTSNSQNGVTASVTARIFNAAGVQNSQFSWSEAFWNTSTPMVVAFSTGTENTANSLVLQATFNVANTDQVTPKFFLVELIQ